MTYINIPQWPCAIYQNTILFYHWRHFQITTYCQVPHADTCNHLVLKVCKPVGGCPYFYHYITALFSTVAYLTLLSHVSYAYPTIPSIIPLPYYPQYHTLILLSPVSHPYPIPSITPLPYYPQYHTLTLLSTISYLPYSHLYHTLNLLSPV